MSHMPLVVVKNAIVPKCKRLVLEENGEQSLEGRDHTRIAVQEKEATLCKQ